LLVSGQLPRTLGVELLLGINRRLNRKLHEVHHKMNEKSIDSHRAPIGNPLGVDLMD